MVDETAWRAEVEEWHRGRIERLRLPDGWLSLVGLEWIEEGTNLVGSDPEAQIQLPANAPERVAVMTLEVDPEAGSEPGAARVRLAPEAGVEVRIAGEAITGEVDLVTDANGSPSEIEIGTLRATVIERGDRFALRIKDTAAPLLESFAGIERFPLDASWRIVARFEPYDPPKMLAVSTALGTVEDVPSPGAVVFERDGQQVRIDAQPGGSDGSLFLVFGDTTNGKTTYGGGRFVYSAPPAADGTVVVDFNRAYNPPCVFTPYSTCPLPLPEAKLGFAIEVGEKTWGGAEH